ncbi:hypothetical protein [Bacillus massiliigorillae]|uniref:hypothetical protein n=1 Tax=Bacillus massiliigorillae TaxID=1243664 RepID=UPI0003AAAAEB|nr:hypothetical protein [Bacillus massiliigorillae]
MIRAEGVVRFLIGEDQEYHANDIFIQNKNLYVEVFSTRRIEESNSIELTCNYKVNIAEKYYCHDPKDYVGQVYPELKKSISRILLTQVVYIDKVFHNIDLN